jgi:L-ascorbate metabolism protein UlaG (beta-lactamase superfamily)
MNEKGVQLRWLGASSVEIEGPDGRIAIDPHISAAGCGGDAVCVTREDHDHCDPAVLRRFASGEKVPLFVVPKSCTLMHVLDAPVAEPEADLSFVPKENLVVLHPRYARSPKAGVETAIEVGGFRLEATQSSDREPASILDRWQRYRAPGWRGWPSHDGAFVGLGELGPQGYLVTHVGSGATVYHPGDLQEVFDFHHDHLRGRVDLMLLPVGPLAGVELSIVEAVRPRAVVPIHYRPQGEAGPNVDPAEYSAVDLDNGYPTPEADPDDYRAQIRKLIDLRWYPSPKQPTERIAGLRGSLEELGTELVVPVVDEAIPVARAA